MTKTRIRLARPEDLPLLPDIERAASRLFVEAGIGGVVSVMPVAKLEAARAEGGLLLAVDGRDVPVGFAVVRATQAGAHLCEMNVHPKHGRQGIGTALLQASLAKAAGPMTLTTYREVPWNAPFYAGQGFVVVPPEAWSAEMAALAAAEGVVPGSGRVLMRHEAAVIRGNVVFAPMR